MHIRNYKDKFIMQKIFIITFFSIFVAFIAAISFLLQLIENHYISDIEQESINFTRNNTKIFEDAAKATEIITNMLDDKLELTGKAFAALHHNITYNDLIILSHEYSVDEVNIFNKNGEIYASNKHQNIGWRTYEGHPTYIFMTGHKKIWMEDIRKDSLSDLYYKYGYYRTGDGCFVQIGILADKYYSLIQAFMINNLLKELHEFSNIISAHFIDDSLNITTHNFTDDNHDFNLDTAKISSINKFSPVI